MLYSERLRMHNEAHAAGKEHSCQCNQKRWKLEPANQTSHCRSEECTDQQRGGDCYKRISPIAHQRCNKDARKCHDRADRKIDAAGKNDKGRSDRCDAQKSIVSQKIDDHAQRSKVRKRETSHRVKREKDYRSRDQRDVLGRDGEFHGAFPRKREAIFPRRIGDCNRQTAKIARALGTGATSALTLRMYIVVVRV
jgi:hypothetical protein